MDIIDIILYISIFLAVMMLPFYFAKNRIRYLKKIFGFGFI